MAQLYRLSARARADLAQILETSAENWGEAGRGRYAAVLAAAMRKVAEEPHAPVTRDRSELGRHVRSFHVRHARGDELHVKRPDHVLYYRVRDGTIEILRVLHERMEPSRHFG